ncbi:hypothetical protein [Mucilaginibacter myungsuensis]|uniref:Transglutaminase superfamily protein n=1 Tax=Mucilaginibacter myungsuensis TaxID=649104 RepID=A0A929L0N4_9SPHI|nr:hypothetical protein [Mucilaginibacter myungsuensis]MBE9664075.1 hypothetical protein [Mucilaginibacter myungsuensis]MDN3601253.1 hypothetical protein [Mucilaginibacter myungsuensis]
MRPFVYMFFALLMGAAVSVHAQGKNVHIKFELYNDVFEADADASLLPAIDSPVNRQAIKEFYNNVKDADYESLLRALVSYKKKHELNDWLYYQLVRRVAQHIAPKQENYARYTLYKWFLMAKSGYDARLAMANNKVIFYIYNDEDIADIPFFMVEGQKYMCLNIHDYPNTDLHQEPPMPVNIDVPGATRAFSYEVTRMPDFTPAGYFEKELAFVYQKKTFSFKVKLNRQVDSLFTNYPGVDFKSYFNIPLTGETYSSLIPMLKKNMKGMDQTKGVDYLMRFTRYAFLYETDEQAFGKERRMSPGETLLNKYSDCDDRAALFFYLVKEIYDLPMIAMLYPTHITMAVQFDKPVGNSIIYQGKAYSVCEPTLQPDDLPIGQLSAKYQKQEYQVVYHYEPAGQQK